MDTWNLLYICFLLLLFMTWIAGLTFAPWVPCSKKDLKRILKLAKLQSGKTLYDLGCGNGRVLFFLAKHASAKLVGIELGVLFFLICKLRQLLSKNKNITIRYENLYTTDLSPADVIYFFGIGDKMPRIRKKLEEAKKGTRIISYAFQITGWEPVVIDQPTKKDRKIYVYEK